MNSSDVCRSGRSAEPRQPRGNKKEEGVVSSSLRPQQRHGRRTPFGDESAYDLMRHEPPEVAQFEMAPDRRGRSVAANRAVAIERLPETRLAETPVLGGVVPERALRRVALRLDGARERHDARLGLDSDHAATGFNHRHARRG